MTAAHVVATQSDSFADFLRVGAAILTLQGAFWLVIIAGIMVAGWMLWFLKPFIFAAGKLLFIGTKIMAVIVLIGLVFAALGKPEMIISTIFYTGYVVAVTVGTVVGSIIGV